MTTKIFKLTMCLFLFMVGTVQPVSAQDDDYGSEIKLTEAEKYAQEKPGTRAAGKGVSARENVAMQQARAEARAAFVEAISSAVKSALKRSGVDLTQDAGDEEEGHEANDGAQKINSMIKFVAEQVIEGSPVVKTNKFFNKKTRRYTVFVCLEYNGDVAKLAKNVTRQLSQRISDEQRLKMDFEFDKFDKELENGLNGETAEENED